MHEQWRGPVCKWERMRSGSGTTERNSARSQCMGVNRGVVGMRRTRVGSASVVTAGQGLSAVIRAGEWGVSSFGNETAELGSVSVVMCGTRCLRNPHCWGANLGPLIGEKVSCTAILRYVTGTMTAPTGAHGFLEFQLPTL